MLVRCGVHDNLDGIYAVLPDLTTSIVEAAEASDYPLAAARQGKLTEFRQLLLTKYPLFPACTVILNARGVPGKVYPAPMKPLDAGQVERLFGEPLIRELVGKASVSAR
jgi:dihydrodipicolinate synthase/N-acetylneuraminate lyase